MQRIVLFVERRFAEVLLWIRHPVTLAGNLEFVEVAVRPALRDLPHVMAAVRIHRASPEPNC